MMARRNSFIYLILALLILFILGLEFFLPALMANMLKDYLRKEADDIAYMNIKIRSFPAIKMLRGKIDRAYIEIEGLSIDNLYLDKLDLQYRDILLKEDGFTGLNTGLEAVITAEAINDYIQAKFPELEAFQFQIEPEQVALEGRISIFEMLLDVQLSGNLAVSDQREVYFIPDNFRVENINIPVNLLKAYIEGLDFSFDLEELNIPLALNEIKLYSGYAILHGGE